MEEKCDVLKAYMQKLPITSYLNIFRHKIDQVAIVFSGMGFSEKIGFISLMKTGSSTP